MTKMMNSNELRNAFLDYFKQKNHTIVASSSLVPGNDPTLLFTNAGMVQFKETFLGQEKRIYTRATSAQRCVRAGGKHNDLENVGYTARHHTFFEMLGNFSFGDYFKRDAIHMAWSFLTEILKLPKEKLWITVYQDDNEAAKIWLDEVGISPTLFSRCGDKDNFWSMGDTGPCGPCTEIFYDHGPSIPGGPPGSEDADGDRYIEIWNLVFMQFNRDSHGNLHPLPKPSVDTGMGLERMAAVLQGVHNNYDIDIFKTIIQYLKQLAPAVDIQSPSFQVIADHIRSCAFLIADGVTPSNEGRGYVLRRIIRRAVRHGNKLGIVSPFLGQLLTPLIKTMGEAYPELKNHRILIERILLQEEEQFARTLELGLRLLQSHIDTLQNNISSQQLDRGGNEEVEGVHTKYMTEDEQISNKTENSNSQNMLSGEIAFKLYDTYGFPIDLTQDIAREHQLHVDMHGFELCMQRQRNLSQAASQFTQDYSTAMPTHHSEFHGYQADIMQANILALLSEGETVSQLKAKTRGAVVLDATPFYAESGGQVGDTGQILSLNAVFQVEDTKKSGNTIIHYGEMIKGHFEIGQTVHAEIDAQRRNAIRLNHTATHLLHAALKQVLGSHVQQKGSLVDAPRARFDFSHMNPLSPEEIKALENRINERIRANEPVETHIMDIESAKKSGAVALFGEKYADEVRVLSIGEFSKELCGGTHARHTGDIGFFKIVAEYGIASGIRRIEMVTGDFALHWINEQLNLLNQLASLLKTTPQEAENKLQQCLQHQKQLEKQLALSQTKIAALTGDDLLKDVVTIDDIKLLVKQLPNADANLLRTTLDQLRSKMDKAVIILYAIQDDNIQVVSGISQEILSRVPNAGQFVKHLCGRGGGRPDMAQGGGLLPTDLPTRLEKIKAMIEGETPL